MLPWRVRETCQGQLVEEEIEVVWGVRKVADWEWG